MAAGKNEFVDAHFLGELVERIALYEFRPRIGEETLALAGEMAVDDITHCSIKNGIAKKLQALVVDGLAFLVAMHDALVHQCQLVVADVVGVKADDVV